MKYYVTGTADYRYTIEAEDEEEAVDKALELFNSQMLPSWDMALDWEAKKADELVPKEG